MILFLYRRRPTAMNGHILTELATTDPQHTRRIIEVSSPTSSRSRPISSYLSYCTVCAHYQRGTLLEVAAAWAEHLDDLSRIDATARR